MADPVTTGLVIAGTLRVAKQAEDFIAAVSGHPGETIGTMLGNIANRQLKNVEAVSAKSHLILLDIGETPAEIPLNILRPALEAASLQEDEHLQETWANFLANAADPRGVNRVQAPFPRILSELSSHEVRFLDHLFRAVAGVPHLMFDEGGLMASYANAGLATSGAHPFTRGKAPISVSAMAKVEDDKDNFQTMMDVLERNRLIKRIDMPTATVNSELIKRTGRGLGGAVPVAMNAEVHYVFTNLGYAFVRACQKPKP